MDSTKQYLLNRSAKVGQDLGKTVDVKSGFRSREEQELPIRSTSMAPAISLQSLVPVITNPVTPLTLMLMVPR